MYTSLLKTSPVAVDLFDYTIEKQGARHAFESAFNNGTTTQIKPEGFKVIQDIECLILWGEKDNLIPLRYYNMFKEMLPKSK